MAARAERGRAPLDKNNPSGANARSREEQPHVNDRPNSLAARDIAYYFHPATNARRHEQVGPMMIERGEGIYVFDDQGKQYIEGLAGLWSVAVGFGEPRLVKAAAEQMAKLPYYHSFSHKSHPSVTKLADRLVHMAPGMAKAHFTSSGSEANDLVMKMIWYYNNALGRPQKKKIISRQKAYHGVSIASGSLSGLPNFHRDFDLPLPIVKHVSCPNHWRFGLAGESEEEFATRLADELDEKIRAEGADTVAAFFGEPVMGAGGVMPPPHTYWEKVQAVCRRHDVLIVADEVITGFGRTGNMFGCQTYGISPDFMVVSKALTSSYFPLTAILFTDPIYQTLADNSNKIGVFGHGFTASGHPVGTAIALENLDIIEERDLVGAAARGESQVPGAREELRRSSARRRSARRRSGRRAGIRRRQAHESGLRSARLARGPNRRALPRGRPDHPRDRRRHRILPAADHHAA
jgi:4-aminobutyrate---pyruvate transaminase